MDVSGDGGRHVRCGQFENFRGANRGDNGVCRGNSWDNAFHYTLSKAEINASNVMVVRSFRGVFDYPLDMVDAVTVDLHI